ncbi:hypothetical protein H9Y04_29890 [Streptomyces sp. TRM66268-LWL]|uniref:Integral membrane protein n=1 Tax=Streptomyces polyasparticus TaxID=2767826 RepID=A0ABR7SR02_9ACTN|nr:hypothetical protein [Streptomyces polyasparticus]MBC9716753.1 hypothetical protein [Streptomyces polyasparticus]
MHGPGYAPPPSRRPSDAALVTLRVVFVVLAIGLCGMLAWAPLIRIAILTKKARDWVLFASSLVVVIVCLALIGSEPTDDLDTNQEWIGLLLLLANLVGCVTYFLYADIKHFHGWSGPAGYTQPQLHKQPPAYGYPPTAPTAYGQGLPHQGVTAPMHPQQQPIQQPIQPAAQQPLPQQPLPTPPPPNAQRPAPARIDQVRAELDELSSFLRGHDETSNGQSGRDFPPSDRDRRPEDDR